MPTTDHREDPAITEPERTEIPDDEEEAALRRELERTTPTRAQLQALIAKRRPSPINYDEESDELPC